MLYVLTAPLPRELMETQTHEFRTSEQRFAHRGGLKGEPDLRVVLVGGGGVGGCVVVGPFLN